MCKDGFKEKELKVKQVDLEIRINVLDEAHFMQCAKDFYFKSWEQDMENVELGVAALELIALSNMNPSPADLGFEYVSYDHRVTNSTRFPAASTVEPQLKCQSCEFTGTRIDFVRAKDLLIRIEPDEPFTDSECPECGALAHFENGSAPVSLSVMNMYLRKLDEYTSNLSSEEAFFDLAKLAMSLAMMEPHVAVSYAKEVLAEMSE